MLDCLAEMQARYNLADPQRMRDALRACIMVALTPPPAPSDPPETD